MNEHEWLTTTNARAMFQYVRGQPRYHPSRWFAWMAPMPSTIAFRKAVLFMCGCLREPINTSDRELIEFCENYADTMDEGELAQLYERYSPDVVARAVGLLQPRPMVPADQMMLGWFPDDAVSVRHADLLRELFGNPFQSYSIDPEWLQRNDGLALKIARQLYEKRAFNELPILADALEEAGCTLAPLLEHLRDPKPHQRGCWALNLLLEM